MAGRRVARTVLFWCSAGVALGLLCPLAAEATWGGAKCSAGEGHHCYALSERNTLKYGGVLASIDFVDSTGANVTSYGFVDNEEWISFIDQGYSGWVETGQAAGTPYGCCEMHPFYAEQQRGVYKEYLSPGTEPLNTYNHYILFDSEKNGRWHVYWGCCEVGYYGGGWPVYLTEQQGGIEAGTEARPEQWGRQEVADSDGGAWTPWSGATYFRSSGICMETNKESPAEGNIAWGTIGYDECA